MRSKKIFAALAAMSMMASAGSFSAFAAETTEEAVTTVAAATEEVTEAAEAEKPEAPVLEDGEKPEPPVAPAELEDGEKPEPPAPPVIVDVTDLIEQIRSFIEANNIEILNDTIIENWDLIEKVDVHFHENEKPTAPVVEGGAPEAPEAVTEAEAAEEDAEKPANRSLHAVQGFY